MVKIKPFHIRPKKTKRLKRRLGDFNEDVLFAEARPAN
jgi:hypothetical protein